MSTSEIPPFLMPAQVRLLTSVTYAHYLFLLSVYCDHLKKGIYF